MATDVKTSVAASAVAVDRKAAAVPLPAALAAEPARLWKRLKASDMSGLVVRLHKNVTDPFVSFADAGLADEAVTKSLAPAMGPSVSLLGLDLSGNAALSNEVGAPLGQALGARRSASISD
jgi:hypothetical protein